MLSDGPCLSLNCIDGHVASETVQVEVVPPSSALSLTLAALAPSSCPSLVMGETQWLGLLVLPPARGTCGAGIARATMHLHMEPGVGGGLWLVGADLF